MYRFKLKLIFFPLLLAMPFYVFAQEESYEDMLRRIDTVENPVYKPVVSLSYGVLNFRGEVKNSYTSAVIGNPAVKLNITTFIDKKQYFAGNFNFLYGSLNGNQTSYTDPADNLNFHSDIYSIGINLEYRFGHLIYRKFPLRPYISLGLENINFSAKGDLMDGDGNTYHYWTDGTIRNIPEDAPGTPELLFRDYVFETDLRTREKELFGLGDYNQRAMGIPVEAGVLCRINDRAFLSLGVSYHYALTDYIDNIAYKNTSIQGRKGFDSYFYTSIGLHFDLFSDPETRTVDLLYADAEFDPLFYDDEDGDFVLDPADHCAGTPFGVTVDTLGCPLDTDKDGVPDYIDEEPGTKPGVWVDDNGVTVTEEAFYASLQSRNNAMARKDVKNYMEIIKSRYTITAYAEIPEKFKPLDADGDGYLSFEELMKAIDDYFDFKLDLTLDELREVNEFFFSQ